MYSNGCARGTGGLPSGLLAPKKSLEERGAPRKLCAHLSIVFRGSMSQLDFGKEHGPQHAFSPASVSPVSFLA